MLATVSKNRRKKRRRKKQTLQTVGNTASSSNLDAEEPSAIDEDEINNKNATYSPKVNVKFINDDVEIETAMMIKHLTKDSAYASKRERDIEFFTIGLPSHILNALPKRQSKEIEAYPDEKIESTVPENYPNDGPILASAYLNNELESVVIPFEKQNLAENDLNELFLPALRLPKQLPDDIESIAATTKQRNLNEEGHYIKPKPDILGINRAQFVNRLLEEGAFHWLDIYKRDVKHLFDIVLSKRLIKTFCAEKFHPIDYPVTTVYAELETFSFQDKILKIYIKDIIFDTHPSFSSEQKCSRELEALYDEFHLHKQNDIVTKIETKLNILRQLLDTLLKSNKMTKRAKSVDNMRIYRNELKELRSTWHRESAKHRELMKNILEKWSEIKKLRESQQTTASTSLKLMIKTYETDVDRDTEEWNERFNVEYQETLGEALEAYQERKLQRKKDGKKKKATNDEPKPKKPDPADIENELLELFAKSMRPPGEHIIDFQLENTDIATIKNLPKYVIRVSLDADHLEFPESTKLNNIGQAHINATFSIKFTTRIPHQLRLQIFEKQNLMRKVAEALTPVPNESDDFQAKTLSSIPFSGQIGKNIYAGKIVCCTGWTMPDIDKDRIRSAVSETAVKIGTASIQGTVGQWFSDQLIDPMDPDNHNLATAIERSASNAIDKKPIERKPTNVFRLNEDLYAFCARDKISDNKRIELLNARFNSDLKLKDCKLIPHNEVEIEIPVDLKIFEDMLWVDPIDVQRYQGKKYLKHVYDIITNHCEVINRNFEHRDLLIGDTPPTLYGALEALTNIFSPRRPLNPHRRTIGRKSNFRDDFINRFNIIINVVRASGIPFRSGHDVTINRRTSLASTMQNLHRQANVRPFVTATFRDKILRTSTVDGSNPTWNEQIVIPIHEGINQIKDSLWFHVYDEIIEDIGPGNDNNVISSTTEIYQKISSHYLGELRIPFSTIYTSQRIEGTFEMSTPIVLLGYTKPAVNVPEFGADASGGLIETRQSILVSLLIGIEPIIELANFSTSHLECIELNIVKNRIKLWFNEIIEEFPHRAQDPLVSLANGKRVCITRLIGPIDIPFERNETSEYMIRRFVSLIPVRPHRNVCTKLNGVWLTNDQLLNILIASPKDLGVLLTCYYLSLGFNAYLVMGFAVPYGDTTFVLTKENGEYFLIDPHTGRKCSSRDTFCALTKVYCIVNQKNVWANIQREHRVFMQNFDTTQSAEWRELFSKSVPAPNESVHDLTLTYADSLDCENLRKSIETKLMKKFNVWRMERKTIWNKRFIEIMMKILQDLETDQCFGIEQKTYTDKLIDATQTKYKIIGYPLNMPYVSIAKVVERVKATEIYLNTDPKVEFSLAVHIQAYPMNVFSIWVFLLALIPNPNS